jgi:hypothetical protein
VTDVQAVYEAALDQLFAELAEDDLPADREFEILTTTGEILQRLDDLGGGGDDE